MKRYRLLVVDDEALIRQGLCARIVHFHFPDLDVLQAASGREALKILSSNAPEVALVDISMPEMNGLEMIELAQTAGGRTRYILLSGYAEFSYAQQGIRLGVRAYLNKPVSNEELRQNIDALLEELRREDHAAASDRPAQAEIGRELNRLFSGGVGIENPPKAYPALAARQPDLFDSERWACLGILHISALTDAEQRLGEERISALRPALRELSSELLCTDGCFLVADCDANPQRLFCAFSGADGIGLRQSLERGFASVQRRFELGEKARATLGVSRVTRGLTSESAHEAHAAIRQRKLYGRSNIYFYEDISAYETRQFPETELELLRKYMLRGDRDGIRRQLNLLFSPGRIEGREAVYLHVLLVRVLNMMMSTLSGLDSAMTNRLLALISRVDRITDQSEIMTMLSELMDQWLNCAKGQEMRTADKIRYALDYIREHYNEDIVINDLAARLDLSPAYFSSMFKRETNQSAMQFITGMRIERACEELISTDQSVASIAKDVGYEDSQYFFRVFKKFTGMTPLQYRQSNPHPPSPK